jgi:flagellar assembly protein FliH
MSDVIKLNIKSKSLKAVLNDDNISSIDIDDQEGNDKRYRVELERQYNLGYNKGYDDAKAELESEYNQQMMEKAEEFYSIIKSFEERIINYETAFEKVVIETSKQISKKIITREIENQSIIETVLKNSLQKVIGANQILIKLNPNDYQSIANSDFLPELENQFNKVKFEEDEKIEKGGCLINTELGNVDSKISTMVNELIKKLENAVEE